MLIFAQFDSLPYSGVADCNSISSKRIAYFCQIMSIVLTLYALLITFRKSTMSCLTFDISFLYLFAEFDIVCRIFLNLIIVSRKKKNAKKKQAIQRVSNAMTS